MDKKVYILLDNLRSVHNVGSIFRTADGAGVTKIYLTGTTPTPLDRFGNKRKDFIKVSLGAEDTVPWQYVENPLDVLKDFKGEIVSVEQDKRSKDFKEWSYTKPTLFIFGNEVDGVGKALLDKSDSIVEIMLKGQKESLNVAITVGIILFAKF